MTDSFCDDLSGLGALSVFVQTLRMSYGKLSQSLLREAFSIISVSNCNKVSRETQQTFPSKILNNNNSKILFLLVMRTI